MLQQLDATSLLCQSHIETLYDILKPNINVFGIILFYFGSMVAAIDLKVTVVAYSFRYKHITKQLLYF